MYTFHYSKLVYSLTLILALLYFCAQVGNIAINDFLLIEATIYKLLKKHVHQKPYYVDVLDLFHDVSTCTSIMQECGLVARVLDMLAGCARFKSRSRH